MAQQSHALAVCSSCGSRLEGNEAARARRKGWRTRGVKWVCLKCVRTETSGPCAGFCGPCDSGQAPTWSPGIKSVQNLACHNCGHGTCDDAGRGP